MTPFGYVMTTYLTTLAIGLSAFLHPSLKLLWHASASIPIGLYAVWPAGGLHVSELVVIRPPAPLSSSAIAAICRKGVPLLKRILALPGQTVCRVWRTIRVDAIARAMRFRPISTADPERARPAKSS